ncbi:MAG: zinc finger Ran-binding domain-containing family 2 protein [Euryarchaeota archaeon]|nr:zinc finger Ran-binding domain-containing family 2 protein [Euryarchaeota archaeon]
MSVHICPACGNANFGDAPSCSACGASLGPRANEAREQGGGDGIVEPQSEKPFTGVGTGRPSGRKIHLGAVVVVAVAVGAFVFAAIVPVNTPFSFSVPISGSTAFSTCYVTNYPHGAPVSFDWSTSDGSTVNFTVSSYGGQLNYDRAGSSGSWSFTAEGTITNFCASGVSSNSVDVHGSVDEPLLEPWQNP